MSGEIQSLMPATDTVLQLLTKALLRKLREAGIPVAGIDETTDLIVLGVVDSQGLLDLILEVEEASELTLDPLLLDLESGVSLERIASAFTAEL